MLDIVAVDSGPMKWVVWCEICDEALTEPTENDEVVEALEADLLTNHKHNN